MGMVKEMKHLGNRGLTLLELIVVFVILATTATLAMPNFQKGVEQKKADSAIASLRKISQCIRLYRQAGGGVIPAGTTYEALEMTGTGNGCYNRDHLAPDFSFPASNSAIPTAASSAIEATWSNVRKVCLRYSANAANQSRSGVIYDYPAGGSCPTNNPCPAASSAFYRCFPE